MEGATSSFETRASLAPQDEVACRLEAFLYEEPFGYALEHVKPEREKNRRASYAKSWWRHVEPRPAMWAAIKALSARHARACRGHPRKAAARGGVDGRDKPGHDGGKTTRYIVTPRVAKHLLFAWLPACAVPDSRLRVRAR